MIVELVIENFALIHRACLQLRSGFTVISGETGVGKSLILQAIQLVLGGRADYGLVREGAPFGMVGLTMDLTAVPLARERLLEVGVVLEDSMLFLQRQITAEGKSVCRVNGKQVPVMVLRQIGEVTVQIHSQHDHQALMSPERPLEVLDMFVGAEASRLRTLVAAQHEDLRRLEGSRTSLQASAREREQRMDLLRYQIEEISGAQVAIGEMERLAGELGRVRNLTRLEEGLATLEALLEGDEPGALDGLRQAGRAAHGLEQLDANFSDVRAGLDEGLVCVEEAIRSMRAYRAELELDPERLAVLEERLDLLRRLVRKYGDSEQEVIAFGDTAALELVNLENADFALASMDDQVARAADCLTALAGELSELRGAAGPLLAAAVTAQLRDLGMPAARFEVKLEPAEVGPRGAEMVTFGFSANAGSSLRDLARVASGGELARVMLALQAVLAHREGIPTLIFDEVDAGLSGRAAAAVGRKLAELSGSGQVLAVSHLAQVVCHAEHQFRTDKSSEEGETQTVVESVEGDARVDEVARLLSGEEVSDTARQNAIALLGVG